MSAIQQMLLAGARDVAPAYKGKTALTTGSGSITVPAASTVSGDLILLFVYSHRGISTPAGYTVVASVAAGIAQPFDDLYLDLYARIAGGSDSTLSLTAVASGTTIGAIKVIVSGADTVNWQNNVASGLITGSSSIVDFYSPVRTIKNTLMVSAAGPRNTSSTTFTVDSYTNPSGLTVSEIQDGVWSWFTNRLNIVITQATCYATDATESLFTGTPSAGVETTAPALAVIIKGRPG